MKKALTPLLAMLAALAGLGLIPAPSGALALTPPDDDGYEVLTRGPVHEAFAESVSFEPEPGIVVVVAPPEPIEELPPEVQPEGDHVEWIPGYWGWDDESDDYLWISGVWRDLPPGRQWVPGYWNTLATGEWQWVSGYWADAATEEVAYISTAPPATLDIGPSVAAPSTGHSWIPGVWIHANTRYVWRPGYWSPLRSGWTWVPARYCWTPRGYVFVDGYWDHAVDRRGVLFAPVRYHRNAWRRPGYHYRPSIVVALNVFTDHLFYRPRTCHYYFGDYYEPRYRAAGYNASWAWHSRKGCYDPIYAYQRWHHRGDRRWEQRLRERHDFRRSHLDARPPRTWSAMRQLSGARAVPERVFASTLGDFRRRQAKQMQFREVGNDRLKALVEQRQRTRQFSQQRQQLESRPVASRGRGNERGSAQRERLAHSPIAGRPTARLEGSRRPPERLEPGTARLRQDAEERMKRAGAARTSPGREGTARARAGAGAGTPATERLEALRKARERQLDQVRERARTGAARPPAARGSQQQRLREAQERARNQQQSRAREAQEKARSQPQQRLREAQERARNQQQQRAREAQEKARSQPQQRLREAQERARNQQQQRARQAQEKARQQQQQRMREAQERARNQQQQRARQAQEKARQQQQQRMRESQERARNQQQQRARQAQEKARQQQQQRLREAQERARNQQQQRARQAQEKARQQQQQRLREAQERARNPRRRGR